jgi:hypothetical protein
MARTKETARKRVGSRKKLPSTPPTPEQAAITLRSLTPATRTPKKRTSPRLEAAKQNKRIKLIMESHGKPVTTPNKISAPPGGGFLPLLDSDDDNDEEGVSP